MVCLFVHWLSSLFISERWWFGSGQQSFGQQWHSIGKFIWVFEELGLGLTNPSNWFINFLTTHAYSSCRDNLPITPIGLGPPLVLFACKTIKKFYCVMLPIFGFAQYLFSIYQCYSYIKKINTELPRGKFSMSLVSD